MSMFSMASASLTPRWATVCLERIEVDHHQIDGLDAQLGDGLHVAGPVPVGQDAAVDGRMQGLDPAVHDLGEAGDLRDAGDGQPGFSQVSGPSPRWR